jgi:membrane carboxypeptidase/penicillin-binding protein PbpC
LNDVAPPAFSDRLRPDETRLAYRVRVSDGLRVERDCTNAQLREVPSARWPTLLEPWIGGVLRASALPPARSSDCRMHAQAHSVLRITGLSDGETIQRLNTAGSLVQLERRGNSSPAQWLVNGASPHARWAVGITCIASPTPGRTRSRRWTIPAVTIGSA